MWDEDCHMLVWWEMTECDVLDAAVAGDKDLARGCEVHLRYNGFSSQSPSGKAKLGVVLLHMYDKNAVHDEMLSGRG